MEDYEKDIAATKQLLDMVDIKEMFYPKDNGGRVEIHTLMDMVRDYFSFNPQYEHTLHYEPFHGDIFNAMTESDFTDYLTERYGKTVGFYEIRMTYLR